MSLILIDQMRVVNSGMNVRVEWMSDDSTEKIVTKILDDIGGPDTVCEKKMRIFVDENNEVSCLLRYHLPQKIFIEKRDVINQALNRSFKKNHFPKTGIFCVWAGWKTSQLFFMEDRKGIYFVENIQNGIMEPIQKKITEAYYIDEFFKVPPSKVFDCLVTENGLLDLLDVVIDCKQEMREFFKDLHDDIEKRNKKNGSETKNIPVIFCGPGAEIMPSIPEFYVSVKHKYAQETLKNWLELITQ